MTHGDKAKAKTAKSSKASAKKASAQGGENGKSKAVKAGSHSGKIGQSSKGQSSSNPKAGQSIAKGGSEKAAAPKGGNPPKESSSRADTKTKGSAAHAPVEATGGFANPAISDAFKQALKKYPNALRKLTD